jgi:hypothetical protein
VSHRTLGDRLTIGFLLSNGIFVFIRNYDALVWGIVRGDGDTRTLEEAGCGNATLPDCRVERILRDDLQRTRKCVQESLDNLLRIPDESDRERMDQDGARIT